ncbi:unnamed protein product, partial [Ixodes persulcatus]
MKTTAKPAVVPRQIRHKKRMGRTSVNNLSPYDSTLRTRVTAESAVRRRRVDSRSTASPGANGVGGLATSQPTKRARRSHLCVSSVSNACVAIMESLNQLLAASPTESSEESMTSTTSPPGTVARVAPVVAKRPWLCGVASCSQAQDSWLEAATCTATVSSGRHSTRLVEPTAESPPPEMHCTGWERQRQAWVRRTGETICPKECFAQSGAPGTGRQA